MHIDYPVSDLRLTLARDGRIPFRTRLDDHTKIPKVKLKPGASDSNCSSRPAAMASGNQYDRDARSLDADLIDPDDREFNETDPPKMHQATANSKRNSRPQ